VKLTDQLSEATVTQKVVKNAESDEYRRLKAENAALKKSLESKFCRINSLKLIALLLPVIKIGQNHVPARESIDDLFEKLKCVIPTFTGDTIDGSSLSCESGMSAVYTIKLIVVYIINFKLQQVRMTNV